jgi:hypothetical protein
MAPPAEASVNALFGFAPITANTEGKQSAAEDRERCRFRYSRGNIAKLPLGVPPMFRGIAERD